MATKDVLAVDFGTANTYYCKCPGDQLTPSGVDFRAGTDGLATAILYRQGKALVVGHVAIEEYGDASPGERKGYVLRTHFKPDIATSDEARRNAHDFLAGVLEEAKALKLDVDPAHREVIIGVPSEAAVDFRKALSETARDAGYGKIRMVDEPKGALLHHVFHKDMAATDALKGLLVVDFGGGTCDFAFMCRGSVRYSWGDMHLGGRLFDDLFFQWFLEANPDASDMLRDEGREFYVLWKECREKKEAFSQSMARDRTQERTLTIDRRWKIVQATWEDFARRAGCYRLSPTLRKLLDCMGALSEGLSGQDTDIDLLGWFRDCLGQGLRDGHIDRSDIRFVILAGGSSQWPFVSDIVREELAIEESRIMRSDRPYAVIAEGLAILPALQEKFRTTQEKLRAELPRFCKESLEPLVQRRATGIARDIASTVTRELFNQQVAPLLTEFRDRGGTVASLKGRIAGVALAFQPRLETVVQERMAILADGLPGETRELMAKWLGTHGIAAPEGSISIGGAQNDSGTSVDVPIPDLSGPIRTVLAGLGAAITALVAAMIVGGEGMALITGPLGLIVGAVIGAVVAFLALRYGLARAKEMAEEWPIPAFMLKGFWKFRGALSDKKIAKVREKLSDELAFTIEGQFSQMQSALEKQVITQVEREIDSLSEVNQL